jgi:hypothetical protein
MNSDQRKSSIFEKEVETPGCVGLSFKDGDIGKWPCLPVAGHHLILFHYICLYTSYFVSLAILNLKAELFTVWMLGVIDYTNFTVAPV